MSIAKQPLPDIESGADVKLFPSPHNRAADYRVHVRKLREMARGEPFGGVRAQLLGLALQYQGLAESFEASTGLNWSVCAIRAVEPTGHVNPYHAAEGC